MTKLSLTLATAAYDRTRPLLEGRVKVEGVDLEPVARPTSALFPLAVGEAPYDVTEMSASSYILQKARGDSRYLAIPAFVSRAFRHSGYLVRADAGIETPKDLEGKRVGVPEYQMTAALWMRGILKDEYGVETDRFRWRTGALEALRHQAARWPEGAGAYVPRRWRSG